ncbi:MAG: presqualene diphosphate synthase HpnD [Sphingomonadales bacterium]
MSADAAREVEMKVRASGTSFYWGMRLQPKNKRKAMFAVYAFCREVDDIADSEKPVKTKLAELKAWRGHIDDLFAGKSRNYITEALLPVNAAFGLEKKTYLAIIEGMEMDARGPIQAPSRKEFDLYCANVAGAVGLLCIRIFGETGKKGKEVAETLGRALQITNILRDLKEDADWDRLYLPRDLLKKHGIKTTTPHQVLGHPGFDAACRELADLAETEFRRADALMKTCDQNQIKPALIMRGAYYGTLKKLQKRGFSSEALAQQSSGVSKALGKLQKIMVAVRYALT